MRRRSMSAVLAVALLLAPALARADIWWGCAVEVPLSLTSGMRMTPVGPAEQVESVSNIYIATFQTPDSAAASSETYAAQFEAFAAAAGYPTASGVDGADVMKACQHFTSAKALAEFRAGLDAGQLSSDGSVKTSSHNYDLAWAPAASKAAPRARARFGVEMQAVTPETAQLLALDPPVGAVVINVVPDSPAAKGGVKPMDVITEISGQAVASPAELSEIVARLRDGYQASVRVWRERAVKELTVQIASLEPEPPVAGAGPSAP